MSHHQAVVLAIGVTGILLVVFTAAVLLWQARQERRTARFLTERDGR